MPDTEIVIEIIGEGKTDRGVLSSLVHSLCDLHPAMKVRGLAMPFAQRGGFDRKVEIAKQNALYRAGGPPHGLVFVVDTEGDHRKAINEVTEGRDRRYGELPTAVGVAHPCIESWLLSDAAAIKSALKLAVNPIIPEHPETLPAPCENKVRNPKTVLAGCAGRSGELTVAEKTAIANKMRDMALVRSRCPKSFAPFADEVIEHIKPLFDITPVIGE
jgi:hypothetical protein